MGLKLLKTKKNLSHKILRDRFFFVSTVSLLMDELHMVRPIKG
jgi:hypothetical protein